VLVGNRVLRLSLGVLRKIIAEMKRVLTMQMLRVVPDALSL
jgi:hypothetical protein